MITPQHLLITYFSVNGDIKKFEKEIPYVLIPDAIRKYSIPRQYTHFEEDSKGDISWFKFPKNIRQITKKKVDEIRGTFTAKPNKCALGGKTHVEVFEKTNKHLNLDYFYGVKKHLVQDSVFDDFIRRLIDTSKKDEDIYECKNKKYNGVEIRKLINKIEYQGLYILSYMLHEQYGITANQKWFDEHVKKVLDKSYPKDMSNSAYGYMQIPKKLNDMITNHDWSKIKSGEVPLEEYRKMYHEVACNMIEIEDEKEAKYEGLEVF